MARYPKAEWRPLPENWTEPTVEKDTFQIHSIVGSAEGAYGYFLRSTNLESHFIVKKNGDVIQLIDTARDADASPYDRAISAETEDNGNPNTDPWTVAQLDTLIDLARWCHSAHGIPLRRCTTPTSGGIGYHTMFGAPSAWTPVAKTCPGVIRIVQFDQVIMPALLRGEDVVSVLPVQGEESADVKELQQALWDWAHNPELGDWKQWLKNTGMKDVERKDWCDGIFGKQTRDAIVYFQRQNWMDDTGKLTVQMVSRLEAKLRK
jgi:hypothetical protein